MIYDKIETFYKRSFEQGSRLDFFILTLSWKMLDMLILFYPEAIRKILKTVILRRIFLVETSCIFLIVTEQLD